MGQLYTLGQLKGAFAAGKAAGQSEGSPIPTNHPSGLPQTIEDQLFKMIEAHGQLTFNRDAGHAEEAETLIAMLWQGGRGEAELDRLGDRMEDRIDAYCDTKFGKDTPGSYWWSVALNCGLEARIEDVKARFYIARRSMEV